MTYHPQGKRVFIKDIIYYLVPPKLQPTMIAPSLAPKRRGVGTESTVNGTTNGVSDGSVNEVVNGHVDNATNGDHSKTGTYPWNTYSEEGNPTVVPQELIEQFHWMFLIRDPHNSIPSFYRCTIPPLDELTGWTRFDPSEAGYIEVRRVFEYLRKIGAVGPHLAKAEHYGDLPDGGIDGDTTTGNAGKSGAEICVIDADDMLDFPDKYIEAVCNSVGIQYTPKMLQWDTHADQEVAEAAFEKWKGWHEDALDSESLHARRNKKRDQTPKPEEQWDKEWTEKYGEKAAKLIRQTVDDCMDDYHYMKQFALKL